MMIEGVHGDARIAALHGADRVRSYGDVRDEHAAATNGVAILDRGGDAVLSIEGRAAEKMLLGFVSGTMPQPPAARGEDGLRGRGALHTVLTPKGRMIADLVLLRDPDADGSERYTALVPAAALGGLLEHCGRFLPPRFARVVDRSAETARVTVAGPEASGLLSRSVFGLRVDAEELDALEPYAWIETSLTGEAVRVVRSPDLDVPAFDLILPAASAAGVWTRMVEAGATPMGGAAWDVLRIEAATPLYGIDTDDGTIPTEAGLDRTAIDHTKGCYTGQEVIVRIRDRGHVNRELRRVLLGDVPTPEPGTELRLDGRDKAAGEVRSAAWSPRFEQTVALAWVRRGVWDPDTPQPTFLLG